MKRFLTVFLALMITLSVTMQNSAFAKVNKKEQQQENKRLEYLNLSWWEHFNDPNLIEYMQEIYDKNNDLKIAALRIKEGEKMVKISFANELPGLSFNGSLGRVMPSGDQWFGKIMRPSYSQYELFLPLTANYEVDIWGKNRFKTKSIEKQLEMIKEDERAAYIYITSSFAAEYFNLVKIEKLIELQKEIIKVQEEIVEKTEKKYTSGLATEPEVLTKRKDLSSFKEELNNLEKTQHIIENQLRVYVADSSKEFKATNYENIVIPGNIPETYNTSVIEQRPDYLRSETYIKKLGCDVSVAKRELLPSFTIYGQLGFNAYEWNKLFGDAARMANAGILPSIDLFTGGKKMAFLKLKKFQYEEAVEKYRKTILTSIQEVNDNSIIYQTSEKNFKQSFERSSIEAKKYLLMQHKNEIGAASDYEILYDKKQALIAQKDEVVKKIHYLISIIGLYKAVGGQDLYNLSSKTADEV